MLNRSNQVSETAHLSAMGQKKASVAAITPRGAMADHQLVAQAHQGAVLAAQILLKADQAAHAHRGAATAHPRVIVPLIRAIVVHQRVTVVHRRVTAVHQRVTAVHQRVSAVHPRATAVHQRVTADRPRAIVTLQKATVGRLRATVTHQRVIAERQRVTADHLRVTVELRRKVVSPLSIAPHQATAASRPEAVPAVLLEMDAIAADAAIDPGSVSVTSGTATEMNRPAIIALASTSSLTWSPATIATKTVTEHGV